MQATKCPECGAAYADDERSCASRFDALLALDHSRREPWGSRHGQAFAAYALQHPTVYPKALDAAWRSLYRIYVLGLLPEFVFTQARREATDPRRIANDDAPPRPDRTTAPPTVTIVDLREFEADTYPVRLDAWCRAALASWGVVGKVDEDRPAE